MEKNCSQGKEINHLRNFIVRKSREIGKAGQGVLIFVFPLMENLTALFSDWRVMIRERWKVTGAIFTSRWEGIDSKGQPWPPQEHRRQVTRACKSLDCWCKKYFKGLKFQRHFGCLCVLYE